MRSEGESHPSLANTSIQKMIKIIPVDLVLLLGLRVGWSVGEVWAAHGSMRCISSINIGSIFLFIQSPVVITLSFCCLYFSSLITPLRFAGAAQPCAAFPAHVLLRVMSAVAWMI